MFVDRRDVRRVVVAAALICAAAWLVLLARPALMHPQMHGESHAVMLGVASWRALLAGWFVMLAAMMPLALISPVLYIRSRSFAHRRARSVAIFLAGYVGMWTLAAFVLIPVQILVMSVRLRGFVVMLGAVAVAVVWQCSPIKQVCLNRCHGYRELDASGFAADRSAIRFGFEHGFYCVGSCWALMLVPMVIAAHLAAMAIATVLIFAERLERPHAPGWRWRGAGALIRAMRAEIKVTLRHLRLARASLQTGVPL